MFEKYQSMPKMVEAVQFTEENKDRVFNSLTGQHAADFEGGNPVIKVTSSNGEIEVARIGDWIVKDGNAGYYYTIKDDIFRAEYV